MPFGILRWYDEANGVGSILSESGRDLFVSTKSLGKNPARFSKDAVVEFEEVVNLENQRLEAQKVTFPRKPGKRNKSARAEQIRLKAFSNGILQKSPVKWYDKKKGFGFISWEGKDVFFHCSNIEGYDLNKPAEGPKDGEVVSFIIEIGTKGLIARKVTRDCGATADDVQVQP
jgi:CspA family cold shock protein